MESENPEKQDGHTGKTNSTSDGEQLRGGDETYSNVYKGISASSINNINNKEQMKQR